MINLSIFNSIVSKTLKTFGFEHIQIKEYKDIKILDLTYDSLSLIKLEIDSNPMDLMINFPHTILDNIFKQMFPKQRLNKKHLEDLGKELTNILAGKLLESIENPLLETQIFLPEIYYKTSHQYHIDITLKTFLSFEYTNNSTSIFTIYINGLPDK